jgi:hypothetical protein
MSTLVANSITFARDVGKQNWRSICLDQLNFAAGTSSFEATFTNPILASPQIMVYIMVPDEINFARV